MEREREREREREEEEEEERTNQFKQLVLKKAGFALC